ncbi:MAG: YitT family protein [Anaerolineae bacterium]|nr:YitT family protein [Thermoflexales bacterium]MDW8395372.1 YitT family protein [Anaerolineae bacterium]
MGALIQSVSVAVFLSPANLAPGGVSGLALILSRELPITIGVGVWILLLNLPLMALGIRYLGGLRFLARTIYVVALYSAGTAALEWVGVGALTQDVFLNTLFGAIVGGIGAGLVFRAQGTTGGTDILVLLLVRWRGIPMSQSYVLTDAVVLGLAALSFGWEKALYAVIALYVAGLAAEAVSEGAHISRMALIITQHPEAVADAVMHRMGRGVTYWHGIGAYTGATRPILFVVISRAEAALLKSIVARTDPHAFLVIGQAQEVYGEGFRQFER